MCSWAYALLVYPDSHVSFDNGRYSVPHQLIGKKVDVKYNPNASIESLDCEARDIGKSKIINLTSMGFVSAATNLIISGPTK